jgi:prepilin-type N-terminal cleavage/methylation domain-containing protein
MRKQQGFTLIEVLVAMAILGVVAVCYLGALTTSSRAAIATDQMDTGRAIAQAQMEWVKNQSFLTSGEYTLNTVVMAQYPGYSAEITAANAAQRDGFIQKVTVTVYKGAKIVTHLEDCKVKK